MPAKIEEDNIKELLTSQQEKNEAIARYFGTTPHMINKFNDCSPQERRERAFASWLVHGEEYASHQFGWELIADVTAHKPANSNSITREIAVLLDDIIRRKVANHYTLNELGEVYAEALGHEWADLNKKMRDAAKRSVRALLGPPQFKYKEEYLYPKRRLKDLHQWLLVEKEVSA